MIGPKTTNEKINGITDFFRTYRVFATVVPSGMSEMVSKMGHFLIFESSDRDKKFVPTVACSRNVQIFVP